MSELKNAVFNRFQKAREKYLPIHDRDLKRWAIQESRKINLEFNASKYWINKFKKDHQIVSRHVTKIVTSRKINQRLSIQKSLAEFRVNVNNELENYEKQEVVNFDQMGINHEIYSKRTLSHCGEKETLMSVNSEFKCTHSHTVMPGITLDGKQYGKLFICLQEKDNKFGPKIREEVKYQKFYLNLIITKKPENPEKSRMIPLNYR